jgi:putative phosphoesterase
VRVAAISDIHGNLPALEAVLADIESAGIEKVVVVGDTVSGPWPAEVFDLLDARGATHVRGNADRLVLSGEEGAIGDWSAQRLGDRRSAVAAWPLTLELVVEGLGNVLVCHSTATSDDPIYTRATPDEDVARLFADVDADVVVCGHTHIQYDRTLPGGLRVVNPGSVGMPYEGRRGAFWAVLGPDVEHRSTEYDIEAAAAAMRERDAPNVEEHLITNQLSPRDPSDVTAYFETLRAA